MEDEIIEHYFSNQGYVLDFKHHTFVDVYQLTQLFKLLPLLVMVKEDDPIMRLIHCKYNALAPLHK